MSTECTHLDQIAKVEPHSTGCEECLETGMTWTLLRMCMICGHVGCCDTSRGKHASKHFAETGHPVVRLLDHPEGTGWCFVDEVFVNLPLA